MGDMELLGTRSFTMEDQRRFAASSGDGNPMHMDPIAARRTQAGQPAVHGVHALLWALDCLLQSDPTLSISAISAKFQRFVPLDREVGVWGKRGAKSSRLQLMMDGGRLASFTIRHGDPASASVPGFSIGWKIDARPESPIVRHLAACVPARGRFPLAGGGELYPALAARLGGHRVAGLAALSYLVGMVLPGLHSIFSAIDIELIDTDNASPELGYEVIHDLSGLLTIAVEAPGLRGEVQAILRPAPVPQPGSAELGGLVTPGAFAGVSALVVGGSRGIGETTAKLLAAGGARVAISYASGAADAEAVAADIRAAGGQCETLRIDAREPIAPQIEALPFAPDQLYYFATTKIFLPDLDVFTPSVFADFRAIYVDAFFDLCKAAAGRASGDVQLFYPSSVAVEDRPRGMTEYAMAKAAGETLCADVDRFLPRVTTVVRRLPRLMTDQTATIAAEPAPLPTEIMLDAITAMMAARA